MAHIGTIMGACSIGVMSFVLSVGEHLRGKGYSRARTPGRNT